MKQHFLKKKVKKKRIRTVLLPVTTKIIEQGTHSKAIGVAIEYMTDYMDLKGESYFVEKQDIVKVVLRLRKP